MKGRGAICCRRAMRGPRLRRLCSVSFSQHRVLQTQYSGVLVKNTVSVVLSNIRGARFACGQAFTRSKFAHIDETNGTRWPFSFHAAAQSLYFGARHTTETIFLTKRTKS